jgi:hypothetical protein
VDAEVNAVSDKTKSCATLKRGKMRNNALWLKAECEELGLSLPRHEMGFTDAQLYNDLSKGEYKALWKWMYGQTLTMDSLGEPVIYVDDVIRGIRLIRHGTPTYWD